MLLAVAEIPSTAISVCHPIPEQDSDTIRIAAFNAETS
jgi:hypothetical protein